VERSIVKDCSYLSFPEELNLSKFVIGENEKKYNKEIEEEVDDMGKDSVGLYDESLQLKSNKYQNLKKGEENKLNSLIIKMKNIYEDGMKQNIKPVVYVLHSVIVHSGSSNQGHYHSYVRKKEESEEGLLSQWWHFDDSKVEEVGWEVYDLCYLFIYLFYYFIIFKIQICIYIYIYIYIQA
jgi:hypothetical protein